MALSIHLLESGAKVFEMSRSNKGAGKREAHPAIPSEKDSIIH
jgi:hypothetical protein